MNYLHVRQLYFSKALNSWCWACWVVGPQEKQTDRDAGNFVIIEGPGRLITIG